MLCIASLNFFKKAKSIIISTPVYIINNEQLLQKKVHCGIKVNFKFRNNAVNMRVNQCSQKSKYLNTNKLQVKKIKKGKYSNFSLLFNQSEFLRVMTLPLRNCPIDTNLKKCRQKQSGFNSWHKSYHMQNTTIQTMRSVGIFLKIM